MRAGRHLAPVDRDDLDRLLEPLERLRTRLGHVERRSDAVERLDADEDLARAGGRSHAGGDVHPLAAVVGAVGPERVARVRADPYVRREDLAPGAPRPFSRAQHVRKKRRRGLERGLRVVMKTSQIERQRWVLENRGKYGTHARAAIG